MLSLPPNEVKALADLLRTAGVEGARAVTKTYNGEPCISIPRVLIPAFSLPLAKQKEIWKSQQRSSKLINAVVGTFLANRPGFTIKIRWR